MRMQFRVTYNIACGMYIRARSENKSEHDAERITAKSPAQVNLLDVAKENMIGVEYEILPLTVINSEEITAAPRWDGSLGL